MTVDVCSASEPFISPRISFSYDLNNQSSDATIAATVATTTDTITFDFCITSNLVQQITSADELFSGGKLLPTQIKNPEHLLPEPKTRSEENVHADIHKKRLKELLSYAEADDDNDDDDDEQERPPSRSFWKFTRSTSVNCDSGRGPKGLFRSLSVKRLSRSNSTDSALNPRKEARKVIEKSNSRREAVTLQNCSSLNHTPPKHHSYNGNNSRQQPACRKNSAAGYGGGIKINPILNIPPSYNNFFGLGSLLCNGKTKKKTK